MALAALAVTLASATLSATAHAGTWTFSATGSTCTVSGSSYNNTDNPAPTWTPPADTTGSMSLSFPGAAAHDKNFKSAPVCSCSVAASVNIKVTWVPDPALDAASDPVPPSVWLIENSSASWTGSGSTTVPAPIAGDPNPPQPQIYAWNASADDGLGDPEVDPDPGDMGQHDHSGASSTAIAAKTNPSAGWKKYTPDANGVITITHSISATASVNATAPGSASSTCSIGGYSVSIHAHPYNFRLTPGTTAMPNPRISGTTLVCHYDWLSTSGKLNDINAGSKIYEHLEYSGAGSTTEPGTFGDQGRTMFKPANPPFGQYWRKPVIIDPAKFYNDIGQGAIWANPQDGYFEDGHKMESALTPVNGTYPAGAFDAAQQYRYYCADEKCPDHIYLPSTYTNNPNRPDDPLVVVAKGTTSATATISRTVTPDGQGSAF